MQLEEIRKVLDKGFTSKKGYFAAAAVGVVVVLLATGVADTLFNALLEHVLGMVSQ